MYSRESLRSLGSYSGKTFGSQILGYFVNNVDNLLVGRVLGSVALGLYSVAYNTMFLPVSRISTAAAAGSLLRVRERSSTSRSGSPKPGPAATR